MKVFIKPDKLSLHWMEHRSYDTASDRKRAQTALHKLGIRTLAYCDTAGKYALVLYRKSPVFEIMNA